MENVARGANRRGDLQGAVALVTGGSRGVGASTARFLADRGATVMVNYRDKRKRAQQVVAEIEERGATGLDVQADMTEPSSVQAMIETIRERFGKLDLLILNASGGLEKDVAEDYAMRLNRDAQLGMVQAALSILVPGGRIVFVTSHLAHFHGEQPVMEAYEPVAASKKAGEVALRAMIPAFETARIGFVVVSGDLIDGTITPKLLNRMQPGAIDERRNQAGWLPTTDDFAKAIVDAATSAELANGDTVYVGSID